MRFRDLHPNYPIFVLNKQNMTILQGKVINRGFPYTDRTNLTQQKMLIDFTIEVDGKTATYAIPEDLSVTYANSLVIAPEKANFTGELEATITSADQVIASVPKLEEDRDKAKQLLSEISPTYKGKQETDERLGKLESTMGELKGMVEKLVKSLGDK